VIRAFVWSFAVFVFLRFGLQPTGWLFYEGHFATGMDWLYLGYSLFRGAGYALSLWDYQNLFCGSLSLIIGFLVLWRIRRRGVRV
jgi:hypothetical protein